MSPLPFLKLLGPFFFLLLLLPPLQRLGHLDLVGPLLDGHDVLDRLAHVGGKPLDDTVEVLPAKLKDRA